MVQLSATRLAGARRAGFMTFLLLGHMMLSLNAWVPEYIDRLGVSLATWGLILGGAPVGEMTAIAVAPPLISRMGVTPRRDYPPSSP